MTVPIQVSIIAVMPQPTLQLANEAGIDPDDIACQPARPLSSTELVSPAHNPCCNATASGASISHGNGLCSM